MNKAENDVNTQAEEKSIQHWDIPTFSGNSHTFIDKQKDEKNLASLREETRVCAQKEGYDAGFDSGKAAVNQLITTLNEMVALIEQPLELINEAVEKQMLHIVQTLSQHLLHHEVSLQPEILLDIISQAKSVIPLASDHNILFLNPEDIAYIKTLTEEEKLVVARLTLKPDKVLKRGECRLVTETVEVDQTVENKIALMMEKVAVYDNADPTRQQDQTNESVDAENNDTGDDS